MKDVEIIKIYLVTMVDYFDNSSWVVRAYNEKQALELCIQYDDVFLNEDNTNIEEIELNYPSHPQVILGSPNIL